MNLWHKLKRLSFIKLVQFSFLMLQKPLLIKPIFKATKEALQVSQKLFGNAHNTNGKANAFRHAYWNYLICAKTLKFTKNEQKSAIWTEKVVNYYEKVTKNEAFDAEMDFHNNDIGRKQFLIHFKEKSFNSIYFFNEMTQNAQKITKIEEIQHFENELVYISE